MQKYKTSYEEDLAIISEPSFASKSFNFRNAVNLRCGEKKILTFFIEFSDYMIDCLRNPDQSKAIDPKLECAIEYKKQMLDPLIARSKAQ